MNDSKISLPQLQQLPQKNLRLWFAAFAVVFFAAIAVRAWIQFRGSIPPAMDAAYYPMQSWWLFNQGRLLYQDAPLIFVLDGLLAKIFIVAGMQSDHAYLVASQVVDCVTEPWVALFIFLFGFTWCSGARRGIPIVMAGAVLAVLSAPVIRMVSDFEKNSLGLVWAALSWWALWRAIAAVEIKLPRVIVARWCVVAAAALALTALTHGGSFGCAVLGALAIIVIWFVIGGSSKRTLLWSGLAVVIVGAISLALLYAVSPSRAADLFTAPQKIFGAGNEMHRPGGPDVIGGPNDHGRPENDQTPRGRDMNRQDDRGPRGRDMNAQDDQPPHRRMDEPDFMRRGRRGGPPGMGGPPSMGGPSGRGSHGTFIGIGVGLCAILVVALRWRKETIADRATILGLSTLCIFLVFPLLNPEYAQRLNLMASVPVGIVFTFLLARVMTTQPLRFAGALWPPTHTLFRTMMAWLISASVSYGAIHSITGTSTPGPVLSQVELQELLDMRVEISSPQTTLVVAAHGVQWWAGHVLHTPVRMGKIPDDATTKYSRVLILQKIKGDRRGRLDEQLDMPENAKLVYEGTYFNLFEAAQ
jgi:hypothetical protein